MDAFFTEHMTVPGGSLTTINSLVDHRILCGSSSGCVRLFDPLRIGLHPHCTVMKSHSDCIKGAWLVGERIITCDVTGLICTWTRIRTKWVPSGAAKSDSIQLNVCAMHSRSLMLCAGFEDGTVKTITQDLRECWENRQSGPVVVVAWSPEGNLLFVGLRTNIPSLNVFDNEGNQLRKILIRETLHLNASLVGCSWNHRGMIIAFSNGMSQLMRGVGDEDPIYINCECDISSVRWSHSGEYVAFASKRMVLFFHNTGVHMKSVPLAYSADGEIFDIWWRNDDRLLYVAVGSSLCVLNVTGVAKHCVSDFGVCILVQKDQLRFIPFNQTATVANVACANLVDVVSDSESSGFVAVVRVGDSFDVILVQPNGAILRRKRMLDSIAYGGSAARGDTVALVSSVHVQTWNRVTDSLLFVQATDPSRSLGGLFTEIEYSKAEDAFIGVALGKGGFMGIARESGAIHIYDVSLEPFRLVKTLRIETRPERINFNCDSSQLSVIDFKSKLFVINVNSGEVLDMKRDECWDLVWSMDSPAILTCMDKNRLYVIRDGKPEEPLSLGDDRLVGFRNLDIITLSEEKYIKYVPSKTLRDCREVLDTVKNIEDAFQYVERRPHARLWQLVAEHALLRVPPRFDIYEKSIKNSDPVEAEIILHALTRLPDPVERQSEGLLWLGKLGEAERILNTYGRTDLLLKLKKKMGDYEWLANRPDAEWSSVTTAEEIADSYFARRQFDQALEWYRRDQPCFSGNRLECLLITNGYEEIVEMSKVIPIDHPVVTELVRILKMSCLCEEAVDLCIRANRGSEAVAVGKLFKRRDLILRVEQHFGIPGDPDDIRALLENRMYPEALAAVRSCGDNTLLLQLLRGTILDPTKSDDFLMKKKAAVLAALLGCNSWSQVEGFHFILVAGSELEKGHYDNALMAALRVSTTDFDFISTDRRRLYSSLAVMALLCKQREICSSAFINLEVFGELLLNDSIACKKLAMKVFSSSWGESDEIGCCPRCKTAVNSRFATTCSLCDEKFKYEIETGYPIIHDTRVSLVCATCSSIVYKAATIRKYCPLCHQTL